MANWAWGKANVNKGMAYEQAGAQFKQRGTHIKIFIFLIVA